ncbi:MAG: ABC transporter permease [Oscillospiraceae bacterium]|nr:ABC transporter permease [Oscillospiraceae bacterium]
MSNILKCDFYRFSRSKLLYALAAFSAVIAFTLTAAIRQGIRVGISVFGDLTAFRGTDDIVLAGVQFHKGLGVIVAILLSVLIGQEYEWKTWQHKWMTNRNRSGRSGIYLSKALFGVVCSSGVFLAYQMTVLFCSNQIREMLTIEYTAMIVSGIFIFAALGAVICMLSMLIKNSAASVIVCLCYVLFSETVASVMGSVGNVSPAIGHVVALCIKHSLFGMSTLVSTMADSPEHTYFIVLNSCAIISLSTAFGLAIFRRYEL